MHNIFHAKAVADESIKGTVCFLNVNNTSFLTLHWAKVPKGRSKNNTGWVLNFIKRAKYRIKEVGNGWILSIIQKTLDNFHASLTWDITTIRDWMGTSQFDWKQELYFTESISTSVTKTQTSLNTDYSTAVMQAKNRKGSKFPPQQLPEFNRKII